MYLKTLILQGGKMKVNDYLLKSNKSWNHLTSSTVQLLISWPIKNYDSSKVKISRLDPLSRPQRIILTFWMIRNDYVPSPLSRSPTMLRSFTHRPQLSLALTILRLPTIHQTPNHPLDSHHPLDSIIADPQHPQNPITPSPLPPSRIVLCTALVTIPRTESPSSIP